MITIHKKEQYDITKNGIKKPFIVIGWQTPDSYSRLFCLWSGGIWFRLRGKKRLLWCWNE
jgi:hypothetical protein